MEVRQNGATGDMFWGCTQWKNGCKLTKPIPPTAAARKPKPINQSVTEPEVFAMSLTEEVDFGDLSESSPSVPPEELPVGTSSGESDQDVKLIRELQEMNDDGVRSTASKATSSSFRLV